MENELDLNLDELDQIETNVNAKLQVKDRFAKLSEKITLTAKEKAEVEAKLQAETNARASAEKERDFFKDFSSKTNQYPNAGQHQDKIWEKVKAGYETEDAIVAVLNKEGQLAQLAQQPTQSNPQVAGGSAITQMADGSSKELREMSKDDKLSALQQLEKEGMNLLKF